MSSDDCRLILEFLGVLGVLQLEINLRILGILGNLIPSQNAPL